MISASILVMLAISLDRYRKTCKIGQRQFTLREKKMTVLAIVIISALINTPILVTSGKVQISRNYKNSTIEGLTCDFSNNKFPTIEKVYCSILLIATIGTFIVSSIFNIRILYVISVKVKVPPKMTRNSPKKKGNSSNETYLPDFQEQNGKDSTAEYVQDMENNSHNKKESCFKNPPYENIRHGSFHFTTIAERKKRLMESFTNGISMIKVATMGDSRIDKENYTSKLKSAEKKQRISLRTIIRKSRNSSHVMFFTIFLVFIISHVAQVITMLYTRYEKYQWILDDNGARVNIYIVLVFSSLLSHAVNPYIYGFFDKELRQSLMKRQK
jgi:hypothetical protein